MAERQKLPVAETALESLLFGLKHVGTALRLGWFGLVICLVLMVAAAAVLTAGFSSVQWQELAAAVEQLDPVTMAEWVPPAAMASHVVVAAGLLTLASCAFLPVAVVLARLAAGEIAAPRGIIYWSWGSREWRTLAMLLIYHAAFWAIATALALFGEALALRVQDSGNIILNWVPPVIPYLILILIIWIWGRMLLLVPAAAIDNDLDLFAALKATGGNVFRLIGSLLVLLILGLLTLLAVALVVFVLAFSLQLALAQTGTETGAGMVMGLLSVLLVGGFGIFTLVASQLVTLAFYAKAWAVLRPVALS